MASWIEFTNSTTAQTVTVQTAHITVVSLTSTGQADVHVVGQDRAITVPQPYADVVQAIKDASEPAP